MILFSFLTFLLLLPFFLAVACPGLSSPSAPEVAFLPLPRPELGGYCFNYKFNNKFLGLTSSLLSRNLLSEPRSFVFLSSQRILHAAMGDLSLQNTALLNSRLRWRKVAAIYTNLKSTANTRCPQGQRVCVVRSQYGPSVCSLFSLYIFIKLHVHHAVLDLN